MSKTRALVHSYVGRKALMALSGLVLLGFVLVHMVANLQMFAGAARIDGYARSLRQAPVLLWSARAMLLGAFVVHVVIAAQLAAVKRSARPVAYRKRWDLGAGTPARSMLWTGLLLALFVLVHLANLTWGFLHPHFAGGQVYANVISLFRGAPAVAFYALAMLALGLHMAHGGWSLWQSLGLDLPASSRWLRRGARVAAVTVAGGLLSVVVAAALGWLR